MTAPEETIARNAARRFTWALSLFILGDIFDEMLSLNLGIFWFRPIKIGLLLGALLTLRYIWIPFHARGPARWLLVSWGAYNLWWGLSIFWNPGFGSFLNQSNIFSRHFQEYILTCGLAGAMIQAGGFKHIRPVFLLFPIFAHFDFLAALGDYIVGHRILPSGLVNGANVYGIGMHGFHHERLNLAEFLILGSAFLMGIRPKGILLKIGRLPLLLVTPFVLFLLDSYSGFLGYLLFILICSFRVMSWWGRFVMIIVALVFVAYIPALVERFVPLAVQKESQARLESRLEGQNSSSWRYVATDHLIRLTINKPQLFGNGYLSTEHEMNEILGNNSSAHTIASIPYEQGLIGLTIFMAFGLCWFYHAGRYITRPPDIELVPRPIYLLIIAMLCCALMRVLFYYQVRNVNFYMLTTAFLSVSYLGFRKPASGNDVIQSQLK